MLAKILRKVLVILIIIAPVLSDTGCKKQPKCGCGNDVIRTLKDVAARVYFDASGSDVQFTLSTDPYSTFHFCNPGEMLPKLKEYKSGDLLLLSGHVYNDCTYQYQASNYSYGSMYGAVYQVQISDLYQDLYGKKK